MNILRQPGELAGRKSSLAIGVFDGVHLGHQQVLRQTIADARLHGAQSIAITFDRHPSEVVAPGRTPPLIYSLPQKLRALASLGLDATLLIAFDQPFSTKLAEDFIRELAAGAESLCSICVGANFIFGHKRAGNVALLQKLGGELKFTVHGIAALALDGETVSSTRIRDAIRAGDIDLASQMLGRPYAIAGSVVAGDAVGRKFGFPTANLDTAGLLVPPPGVYAVRACVDGVEWPAALNIGMRPTLGQPEPSLRVEAHLIGFSGNLYGRELELVLVEKLRDEKRFDGIEALRAQIARDIAATRELLG